MPKQKAKPRRTTVQAGLRLPAELIAALDAFAEELAEQTGLPVNRTQATVWLLRRALKAERGKQ